MIFGRTASVACSDAEINSKARTVFGFITSVDFIARPAVVIKVGWALLPVESVDEQECPFC
jgi:hypothetical protein